MEIRPWSTDYGPPSNRRLTADLEQKVVARVRQRYADFGPTLASEHLAQEGLLVSRETLRKWMTQAAFWRPRRQRMKKIYVWRERRASFGELVMQDSSPFLWLEDRGPACQLIALIDDATSKIWARFSEHDSTEENLRTLGGWLRRYGRPVAHYTDKNSIFRATHQAGIGEQLQGEGARSQFGRALKELGIEWIAAQSPQAKGRIERLFETLQDRLVKECVCGSRYRRSGESLFRNPFPSGMGARFTVLPRHPRDAHRPLVRAHRLDEILSVRATRQVADDHTVSWEGNRWGVPREEVCAGLRRAQVEIERRLDSSHWPRFRGCYLSLRPFPVRDSLRKSFRPTSSSPCGRKPKPPTQIKTHYIPPPNHPWRKSWKRTILNCKKPDISSLR